MQIITASCPACGGMYDGRITSRFVTCEYCGSRFALSKEELEALGFVDRDGDGYDDNDTRDVPQEATKSKARQDDGNRDPMPTYARNACQDFLSDRNVDEDSFRSSRKILDGLDVNDEDVYLIHDDTLFKSGKNGFAITDRGFSCREMAERRIQFTDWDTLAEGSEPELDDSYIRQDGTALVYFSDNNDVLEHQLYDLVLDLYNHACNIA